MNMYRCVWRDVHDPRLLYWICTLKLVNKSRVPSSTNLFCFYASLLKANRYPSKQEIEDNFDGNICRCTGEVEGEAAGRRIWG